MRKWVRVLVVKVEGDEEEEEGEEGAGARVRIVRVRAAVWILRVVERVGGSGGEKVVGGRLVVGQFVWGGDGSLLLLSSLLWFSGEMVVVWVMVAALSGVVLIIPSLSLLSLSSPFKTAVASAMVSERSLSWPAMKDGFCGSPVQVEMSMMSRAVLRRVARAES